MNSLGVGASEEGYGGFRLLVADTDDSISQSWKD